MNELIAQAKEKRGELLSERTDRWVVAIDDVVIKIYLRRTGWRGLLEQLFGDRAERAFRAGKRAKQRGIAIAEPLQAIDGALVMQRVHGGERTPTKARVLAVARLLRSLHQARLYPGDFHEKNVLFAADVPVLIDYDGLRPVWFVSRRRRVRNLERLYRDFLGPRSVSRTLRMRFLVEYAGRAEARALWREVAERSARKRSEYGL